MAAARTRSRFDRDEAKPGHDVYTGLLSISLLAMIGSCVLLYLDYGQYGSSAAPKAAVAPPAAPRQLNMGAVPPAAGGATETPMPMGAAPALLPEPVALEQPKPLDPAPVQPVAAIDTPMPMPVTTSAAEAPAPAPPAPEPLPPVPAPLTAPAAAALAPAPQPAPPPATGSEQAPPAPAPNEPAAPALQGPPADGKPLPPEPPPLPQSIKQLPN